MANLIVYSLIFGILYALAFLFFQKTKIFKVNLVGLFVFTAIMYFVLTLLLGKFVHI